VRSCSALGIAGAPSQIHDISGEGQIGVIGQQLPSLWLWAFLTSRAIRRGRSGFFKVELAAAP